MASGKFSAKIQNRETSQTNKNKLFETFNLNQKLIKGLYNMGFQSPSKLQKTILPILLTNPPRDLIVQCQFGIDRTSVIVLTMLSKTNTENEYPQIIYIAPRHELAVKTAKMASLMAKFYSELKMNLLNVGLLDGKMTEHIIIGTPEKLYELGFKRRIIDLRKISVFILDEVESYEEQVLMRQCLNICKNLSPTCQRVLFSTTYNKEVMDFASSITNNPAVIKTTKEMLENTLHYYIVSANFQEKCRIVKNMCTLLESHAAIIFCDSRKEASSLYKIFSKNGLAVALLSGDISGEQRTQTVDEFKNCGKKILISTYELLIRDINVGQIVFVINFNLPINANGTLNYDLYLCRTNHAGILGNHGLVINLVDNEQSRINCETIANNFNIKINYLDTKDATEMEKICRMISL